MVIVMLLVTALGMTMFACGYAFAMLTVKKRKVDGM